MQKLLVELNIEMSKAPMILCDNISVGFLSKNLILHSKLMYVDIDFYFIRKNVLAGEIGVECTSSQEQLADIMNISLSSQRFH